MSQELTDTQWQAIRLLVAGKSKTDVATSVGVVRETVSRWSNDPAFKGALNECRVEVHEAAASELHSLVSDAVFVFRDSLNSENPSVRLRAAQVILKAVKLDVLHLDGRTEADIVKQLEEQRRIEEEEREWNELWG